MPPRQSCRISTSGFVNSMEKIGEKGTPLFRCRLIRPELVEPCLRFLGRQADNCGAAFIGVRWHEKYLRRRGAADPQRDARLQLRR